MTFRAFQMIGGLKRFQTSNFKTSIKAWNVEFAAKALWDTLEIIAINFARVSCVYFYFMSFFLGN